MPCSSRYEANNKELQAAPPHFSQNWRTRQTTTSPDPTLSYHLWDSRTVTETVGEMVISQTSTSHALRHPREMNRLRQMHWMHKPPPSRQQILLQAKEVCLDIIMLQRQQALLDERLKECGELSAMYTPTFGNGRCQCTGNQQD